MKINKRQKMAICMITLSFFMWTDVVRSQELKSNGTVSVEKSQKTTILDPENPENKLTPENVHSTNGALRIDFASDWSFGKVELDQKEDDAVYHLHAQRFLNSDAVRGSFIQITDQREMASSWTLQVKQNTQLRNPVIQNQEEQTLHGAILSLDKIWVNSIGDRTLPTVTRDTIAFQNFNQAYNIARLENEKSQNGTWFIVFGASPTNKVNQENTLKPKFDEQGKPLVDDRNGKPIYTNEAISIRIPLKTPIYPVTYETSLTWILGDLP